MTMRGSVGLITGATSGIGRATARALHDAGADLILVGRNRRAGEAFVRQLTAKNPMVPVKFLQADLSDQSQVRRLAATVREMDRPLDVLVNNAGARFDHFQTSPDGVELTFATNYLGHFLLTALLLDRLRAAPAGRVVNLGSCVHWAARDTQRWDLAASEYDRSQAYAKSKLACIVFTFELARRLGQPLPAVNAADPGLVATRFARNNGWLAWFRHVAYHAIKLELVSARRGADTVVYLASDPVAAGKTGGYFRDRSPVAASAMTKDLEAADRLWTLSVRLTGLNESIGAAWTWFQPTERETRA